MRLKDKQLDAYGAGKKKEQDAGEAAPPPGRVSNPGGAGSKGSGPTPAARPRAGSAGADKSGSSGAPEEKSGAKQSVPAAGGGGLRGKLPAFLKTDSGELAYRKVAKFLIILGQDEGAKILALLEPEQIERVTAEIANVKSVNPEEAERLLDEFGLRAAKAALPSGGVDTAREMLVKAFGREKGMELLRRAAPAAMPKPFDFLLALEPQQALLLLKDESLAVVALVLSRVEPAFASKLLSKMNDAEKRELVLRIARMGKVAPEILARTETALEEKARRLGRVVTEEIDGTSALAGILRHMSPASEQAILDALDEGAPDLGERVKDKLFTLEDILDLSPKDLQEALRAFADRDLALALKGKEREFRDRILANVSEQRRALIIDEGEVMGAVRREDCDQATQALLAHFKRLHEAGKIILLSDAGEYIR